VFLITGEFIKVSFAGTRYVRKSCERKNEIIRPNIKNRSQVSEIVTTIMYGKLVFHVLWRIA